MAIALPAAIEPAVSTEKPRFSIAFAKRRRNGSSSSKISSELSSPIDRFSTSFTGCLLPLVGCFFRKIILCRQMSCKFNYFRQNTL